MDKKPSRHLSAVFPESAGSFGKFRWEPLVDVYRTEKGWAVKLELAGVRREDISWSYEPPILRIEGSRKDILLGRGFRPHSLEITYEYFSRSVELPCRLANAVLKSHYSDGMLVLELEGKELGYVEEE